MLTDQKSQYNVHKTQLVFQYQQYYMLRKKMSYFLQHITFYVKCVIPVFHFNLSFVVKICSGGGNVLHYSYYQVPLKGHVNTMPKQEQVVMIYLDTINSCKTFYSCVSLYNNFYQRHFCQYNILQSKSNQYLNY